MNYTKYPLDLSPIQNKTDTLTIVSNLYESVGCSNDNKIMPDSPYKVYNAFSRYVFTLISNRDKSVVTANIPVKAIAGIRRKTDYAFQKHMDNLYSQNDSAMDEDLSPAYTVILSGGYLKGKTPAQALLENDANKGHLNEQYEFLRKNLDKYPGNQIQMDAIKDASKLLSEGRLVAKKAPAANAIEIYSADMRPLKSKIRDDGKWFVYSINIKWNIGQNYPVEVSISNFYAPVDKREDGTLNVRMRDKSDEITKKTNVSKEDWLNCLREICVNMDQFELLKAKSVFTSAKEASLHNREQSKSNSGISGKIA